MTKSKALYQFFSGFDLDAYPASSVPDDVVFPYLTYENSTGNAGDPELSISVKLWYHTDSETIPNAKAEEIAQNIGLGGKIIPCDNGAIWIKRGSPWCTATSDQNDPAIKLRVLNITLNFM